MRWCNGPRSLIAMRVNYNLSWLLLGVSNAEGWWSSSAPAAAPGHHGKPSALAAFALEKVLSDASPVFGSYVNVQTNTSTWTKAYPDSIPLVRMNILGTHDSATWNYSIETQQRLQHITALAGVIEVDPTWWRCQDRSYIDMLNDGIRVFDLRYAFDITNSTLVFWHGPALQSQTATVDDAMFAFYQWLVDHPSEAIFLSFQYQGNTIPTAENDAGVQLVLHSLLTSSVAKQYIRQGHTLGSLGEARGKITLLRRFDLDLLSPDHTAALPGLHFSPDHWTDNGPSITLQYNDQHDTAYIEDYYRPLTTAGSTAVENIQWKVNATEDHLAFAAGDSHPSDLFWTFASSTNIGNVPPNTPAIQALGNASLTPAGGVNYQLFSFLENFKGKRLGIVMFDFYEQPDNLLQLFLSLQPPPASTDHQH